MKLDTFLREHRRRTNLGSIPDTRGKDRQTDDKDRDTKCIRSN